MRSFTFDLKDYYKILKVPRLASLDEIKRSYRRLASKYHPDVNPDPNAHFILTEINEAYSVLGNTNLKWMYDQQLEYQNTSTFSAPVFAEAPQDLRKRRRGHKETPEEKQQKIIFAIARNRAFNIKMKYISLVIFLFSGLIFLDHYLPSSSVFQKAYPNFRPEKVEVGSRVIYNLFLQKGKQINMEAIERNEEAIGLRSDEALFVNTPLLGVHRKIQVGKIVFKQLDGLYELMLLFGIICLISIYVLFFRLNESMVLPTILTFFNGIIVLAFFILWLGE